MRPGRCLHALRHTAGAAVDRATHDLVAVQAWPGHASINTSRIDVHRAAHENALATALAPPTLGRYAACEGT